MKRWISGLSGALAVGWSIAASAYGAAATYKILETADHDPSLFTQGLIVDGTDLIESSGKYGVSKLVRYNAATGQVIRSAPLPASVFAEGLVQHNGSLYLLTWKERKAFRLDPADLNILQEFPLDTEGWGLTHDGQHFIQSNGSDILFFRNSSSFKTEKKLSVREGMYRWSRLNELEYAHGLIWANVFMTSTILAISPEDGQVAFSLDLSPIAARHKSADNNQVLNGIAYDPKRDAFWVTGKYWNKRYLIRIIQP
ncbi:glutaminyl-peptide cyclotransferase [Pontiellaceae bacterium B12227]|nr:glutaminyl-peptide cyclotransferase [Pontiellaceae bacterium B12227]